MNVHVVSTTISTIDSIKAISSNAEFDMIV